MWAGPNKRSKSTFYCFHKIQKKIRSKIAISTQFRNGKNFAAWINGKPFITVLFITNISNLLKVFGLQWCVDCMFLAPVIQKNRAQWQNHAFAVCAEESGDHIFHEFWAGVVVIMCNTCTVQLASTQIHHKLYLLLCLFKSKHAFCKHFRFQWNKTICTAWAQRVCTVYVCVCFNNFLIRMNHFAVHNRHQNSHIFQNFNSEFWTER